MTPDPFAQFKAAQREAWSLFAPQETFTMMPAAALVKFAQIAPGMTVLDAACGTGVVAVSAARLGADVRGLDLSPALLERARWNAGTAGLDIAFVEGDVEALPYPDASFDAVLSQFGHIFAPRPALALQELLRVLRPGGRIAFSTWPPELFVGRQFALLARYLPPPPAETEPPAAPAAWGDPATVRERLGARVTDLLFERGMMIVPALSPQHARVWHEATIGPLAKIVGALQSDPAKLARLRAEFETMAGEIFADNHLHMHYLMVRALKHANQPA